MVCFFLNIMDYLQQTMPFSYWTNPNLFLTIYILVHRFILHIVKNSVMRLCPLDYKLAFIGFPIHINIYIFLLYECCLILTDNVLLLRSAH